MFFNQQRKGLIKPIFYVVTIIIVALSYGIIGQIPLFMVTASAIAADPNLGSEELALFQETLDFSIIGLSQNAGLVIVLMIFVIAMIGLYVGVKYVHKLPFKALITPYEKINWKKIIFSFGLWFLLSVILEGIIYLTDPGNYMMSFDAGKFFVLLVISLLLIPIQTSWEEMMLRGYLMPAIGLITGNKWIPLIVTSIIFALLHGLNPEVEKYGIVTMFIYYIGAALFLGIITILDDSLELALGVHAATNIFAALFITFDGSALQTDALFRLSKANAPMMSLVFFTAAIIFYFICSKKYKWKGIESIFDDIEPLQEENELTENYTI